MDLDKALSEIDEIRSHLAGQVLFQGFGPVSVACTGLFAVLVALAQVLMPTVLASDRLEFLLVWVFATCIASMFITAHMWHRAKELHGTQSGAMLNRLFEQLMPPVFVVLVITAAFFKFAQSPINALPGLWLLMAALASFAMASSLGNRLRIVGVWYFLTGAAVLVIGLNKPEIVLSPWLLGVPFLIGQLSMAAILKLENRSHDF